MIGLIIADMKAERPRMKAEGMPTSAATPSRCRPAAATTARSSQCPGRSVRCGRTGRRTGRRRRPRSSTGPGCCRLHGDHRCRAAPAPSSSGRMARPMAPSRSPIGKPAGAATGRLVLTFPSSFPWPVRRQFPRPAGGSCCGRPAFQGRNHRSSSCAHDSLPGLRPDLGIRRRTSSGPCHPRRRRRSACCCACRSFGSATPAAAAPCL